MSPLLPKADMRLCTANVHFRGESGPRRRKCA